MSIEKTTSQFFAEETSNNSGLTMNSNKETLINAEKEPAVNQIEFKSKSPQIKNKTPQASTKKASKKVGEPIKTGLKSPKKSVQQKEISGTSNSLKKGKSTKQHVKIKAEILEKKVALSITFQLKYRTNYGETIYITANHPLFGNGNIDDALPMNYLNDEYWSISIDFSKDQLLDEDIVYHYFVRSTNGSISYDFGNDKVIHPSNYPENLLIIDSWNYSGYYENAFYTEPFQKVLLQQSKNHIVQTPASTSHTFKVKAPLLAKNQTLCILGSAKQLGNWDTENPIVMHRNNGSSYFEAHLNLTEAIFPIAYKYAVYDTVENIFINFESGNNRILFDAIVSNKQTIVNDVFAILPSTTWKGTGIAIPVFSLRSEQSFGVGEFTDIHLLVDWCKQVGIKMVQILPINDTTSTLTNADSYPYAAISAFALHPLYINLSKVATEKNKKLLNKHEEERKQLNKLDTVDYGTVMNFKIDFIKKIFPSQQAETFSSTEYKNYFKQNKHWLIPYATFCYLRDQYGTSNYKQWPAYRHFKQTDIDELTNENSLAFKDIALHYFIQFHLHLQLKEATSYAHENGIIVKGDIAIGVFRYGTDAWQAPELFNMQVQAGAPPDDFAVKGQNWGFPTYNWQRMKEDGYNWWRQRFEQMSYYFDAFRIDHILGFFRIWSIPIHAIEGIMGNFVPAIPIYINEFNEKGISFDYHRYTKPFINDSVLWQVFGTKNEHVKNNFLNYDGFGNYTLKPDFATQVQVENYFVNIEHNELNNILKQGLFDLISNVILFEVEGSEAQQFHFRFGINNTLSYKNLDNYTQQQLDSLYIIYFFKRQDDFWMQEAIQKLPALKRVTNMLICGEDLGMVPDCVPEVMQQLGLLSLEIQRMPKDPKKQFFHPNDAPYLSVVTPSTHDMSTIRGWWEEDKTSTQKFFNNELGQGGEAPQFCEAWINKAIVVQHLYSPAMWAVFQLQDLLGIDEEIRRENPNDERINIPANPKHYWCYRMHLSLEQLQEQTSFNNQLKKYIQLSGR